MAELIQIRREPGGRWRWVYLAPDEEVELSSSEHYASRGAAEAAAARAYPGLRIEPSGVQGPAPEAAAPDLMDVGALVRSAVVSGAMLVALLWVVKRIGDRAGGR